MGKVLGEHLDPKTNLSTESYQVYTQPGQEFVGHEAGAHGKGYYSRGVAHTNTAEVHFAELKRSIDCTHLHVSDRHLDRYLAECGYRYSTRKLKDEERTEMAIRKSAGKRQQYEESLEGMEVAVRDSPWHWRGV